MSASMSIRRPRRMAPVECGPLAPLPAPAHRGPLAPLPAPVDRGPLAPLPAPVDRGPLAPLPAPPTPDPESRLPVAGSWGSLDEPMIASAPLSDTQCVREPIKFAMSDAARTAVGIGCPDDLEPPWPGPQSCLPSFPRPSGRPHVATFVESDARGRPHQDKPERFRGGRHIGDRADQHADARV